MKQRNALLRQRRADSQLDAWEHELAQAGEALTTQREAHVARLEGSYSGVMGLPLRETAGLLRQVGLLP